MVVASIVSQQQQQASAKTNMVQRRRKKRLEVPLQGKLVFVLDGKTSHPARLLTSDIADLNENDLVEIQWTINDQHHMVLLKDVEFLDGNESESESEGGSNKRRQLRRRGGRKRGYYATNHSKTKAKKEATEKTEETTTNAKLLPPTTTSSSTQKKQQKSSSIIVMTNKPSQVDSLTTAASTSSTTTAVAIVKEAAESTSTKRRKKRKAEEQLHKESDLVVISKKISTNTADDDVVDDDEKKKKLDNDSFSPPSPPAAETQSDGPNKRIETATTVPPINITSPQNLNTTTADDEDDDKVLDVEDDSTLSASSPPSAAAASGTNDGASAATANKEASLSLPRPSSSSFNNNKIDEETTTVLPIKKKPRLPRSAWRRKPKPLKRKSTVTNMPPSSVTATNKDNLDNNNDHHPDVQQPQQNLLLESDQNNISDDQEDQCLTNIENDDSSSNNNNLQQGDAIFLEGGIQQGHHNIVASAEVSNNTGEVSLDTGTIPQTDSVEAAEDKEALDDHSGMVDSKQNMEVVDILANKRSQIEGSETTTKEDTSGSILTESSVFRTPDRRIPMARTSLTTNLPVDTEEEINNLESALVQLPPAPEIVMLATVAAMSSNLPSPSAADARININNSNIENAAIVDNTNCFERNVAGEEAPQRDDNNHCSSSEDRLASINQEEDGPEQLAGTNNDYTTIIDLVDTAKPIDSDIGAAVPVLAKKNVSKTRAKPSPCLQFRPYQSPVSSETQQLAPTRQSSSTRSTMENMQHDLYINRMRQSQMQLQNSYNQPRMLPQMQCPSYHHPSPPLPPPQNVGGYLSHLAYDVVHPSMQHPIYHPPSPSLLPPENVGGYPSHRAYDVVHPTALPFDPWVATFGCPPGQPPSSVSSPIHQNPIQRKQTVAFGANGPPFRSALPPTPRLLYQHQTNGKQPARPLNQFCYQTSPSPQPQYDPPPQVVHRPDTESTAVFLQCFEKPNADIFNSLPVYSGREYPSKSVDGLTDRGSTRINAEEPTSKLAPGGSSRRRKKCNVPECGNRVVNGGVCISHGAKRLLCKVPECTKPVRMFGLCSAHGRPRCDAEGCINVAAEGGKCITHVEKCKKVIPDHKVYVSNISPDDVLLGRGGLINNFVGNKRYRLEVDKYRKIYATLKTREEKNNVIQAVVDAIRIAGGRFLERENHVPDKIGQWYIVPNIVARGKASQALREGQAKHRRCRPSS